MHLVVFLVHVTQVILLIWSQALHIVICPYIVHRIERVPLGQAHIRPPSSWQMIEMEGSRSGIWIQSITVWEYSRPDRALPGSPSAYWACSSYIEADAALWLHDSGIWRVLKTGRLNDRAGRLLTSKVRISCCVRSLEAAHLVRSPCKLEMEISIMFWMSSHWCSAAVATPPPLPLSGCSSLSTILPPLVDTLSIPQHWARLEGLEGVRVGGSNRWAQIKHMQQSSDAATCRRKLADSNCLELPVWEKIKRKKEKKQSGWYLI